MVEIFLMLSMTLCGLESRKWGKDCLPITLVDTLITQIEGKGNPVETELWNRIFLTKTFPDQIASKVNGVDSLYVSSLSLSKKHHLFISHHFLEHVNRKVIGVNLPRRKQFWQLGPTSWIVSVRFDFFTIQYCTFTRKGFCYLLL